MRPALGEAGGRSSVHRCWQVFPWRPDPGLAPLCPCLSALPRRGVVVDTPLGWPGGPCVCLGPAKTPPWRPRACLSRMAVIPTLESLGGARGAWGVQGGRRW